MAGKASQQLVRNFDGIFRRQVDYTLRGVDESKRSVRVTASTTSVDSHGDIVEQDFKLDRYRKNPVILFNHHNFDSSNFSLGGAVDPEWLIPIGRAEDVGVSGGNLEATIIFATDKVSTLAEKVYQAFREKMMSAVSIGFRPHKIDEDKLENGTTRYRLSQNELFEISAVPMPSNPDAVAKSLRMEHDWIRHAYFKKGIIVYTEYPLLETASWDADDALARVRKWAANGSDDPAHINFERYKDAFSWFDASNPTDLDSYKGLHHDVKDGWLYSSKAGLVALGNALQGSRAGLNIPAEDVPEIKKHLEKHYEQFNITAPWLKSETVQVTVSTDTPDRNNVMDLEKMKAELEAKVAEIAVLKAHAETASEKFKAISAERDTATARVAELETELKTEKTASEKLMTEFKSASDKVTALEEKNASVVIEGYVGKKLTPAERDEHLDLVKTLGLDRVEKMLKARPDLKITEEVEVKTELKVPSLAEDASAQLVDMANKAIKK